MKAIRPKLLESLIGKKLYAYLERALELAERNFDVALQFTAPDVQDVLLAMCEAELRARHLPFAVATSWDSAHEEKRRQDEEVEHASLIYLGSEIPPVGSGFISIAVPSVETLLPSTNATVSRILEHAGLETYLDVFDAKKMAKIKNIASTHGLGMLIDAVLQTAYLSGFSGNEQGAEEYLNCFSSKTYGLQRTKGNVSFVTLIEDVVRSSQSPHCYLKAALSYYIVRSQGNSMTNASKVLNISRTTLQQHLRLAEKFKIHELFD